MSRGEEQNRLRGTRSLRDVYLSLREKGQSRRQFGSSLGLASTLLLCAAVQAQTAPGLHHRSVENPDEAPAQTIATGHTTLPSAAEGEYPWSKLGQEIELYFDGGRLHGYMTEPSDPQNNASTPITFDFATSHVDGHAVAWTTRKVHGDWWSFEGHLERGLVASPSLPGYYLLTGTLTEHTTDAGDLPRTVSLKREPGSD